MKRTEMVTLNFFIELGKVWPALVSTLCKIHSTDHPSYTKTPNLHIITYITQTRKTFCTSEKFITLNEMYTKLRHNLPGICEIEINWKHTHPSCSKHEIVPHLYLLINHVNMCFVHFHHVHSLGVRWSHFETP